MIAGRKATLRFGVTLRISLPRFDWPVTPEQAAEALEDFIMYRLPALGPFQDAVWTGETYLHHSACPFTTLFWDFLMRHEARFRNHPRAGMQWRNLARLGAERRDAIRSHEVEAVPTCTGGRAATQVRSFCQVESGAG